jgi:para-aminobenzoate synthetase/4-amino-4-deoxychorismate lyase
VSGPPGYESSYPNPRAGIFETLLVHEGRPIELDAHLERLRLSVAALYDCAPPPAHDEILAAARGGTLGRLRLTVEPGPDGALRSSIVVAPFDPNNVFPTGPFTTALHSLPVERGYGEHKWADRDPLARAEAAVGPGAAALLVGPDERVYEATRANLFAVRDDVLLTPPLDGTILPGIARAGVLEVAAGLGLELREPPLTLADLRAADEVFLTGSLRGVEPAHELDGDPLPRKGALTAALAAGLRRRWFGSA